MNLTERIKENFIYFRDNVLPYIIVLELKNESIIINPSASMLMHMLGVAKSSNVFFKDMSAARFYKYIEKSLASNEEYKIVDKNKIDADDLTHEEKQIIRKNDVFIEMFESFFSNIDLRIFEVAPSSVFDTDYVHFKQIGFGGGYIGVIGGESDDFHYFNSVQYEIEKMDKYKGPSIQVYNVRKIKREVFELSDFNMKKSKRNINNIHMKAKKDKTKKIDFKKEKNKINKLLSDNFRIDFGRFGGSKSIQLYRGDELLCKNLLDDNTVTDIETLISKAKEYTK